MGADERSRLGQADTDGFAARSIPVLLPNIRDPRLHLAAVIISLQVLGQVAFEFRLSIAQILVSLADLRRCSRWGSHSGAST